MSCLVRVVCWIILAVWTVIVAALFAIAWILIFIFVSIPAGVRRLLEWAELQARFRGDRLAQQKAHWREE